MTIKQIEFWTKKLLECNANVKIISKAVGKMEKGVEKYGDFNPESDDREFVEELLKELYDGINYCLLGSLKEPSKEESYSDLLNQIIPIIHFIEQRLR